MLRKIHLHGALGKKYGRKVELDVATVGEAVRGLAANFSGFLVDLKDGTWRIVRGNPKTGLELELEDVNTFKLGNADLHFFPVAAGSKRGVVKAVVGVALTAAAIGGAIMTGGATIPGTLGLLTFGNVAMVGLSLSIAGVASMLAPKEQPKSNQVGQLGSHQLGPTNTYEQGNPVPLVYGELICGSVVISSGLNIDPLPA